VFTPPLADATSMVQKVRNARPDVLLMLTTSVPDTKLVLEKLSEMGLGKGRLAVIANGGHMGAPELLNVVGKDLMEGVMVIIANWGGKGQEQLIKEFTVKTKEPWMTQDSISTYGDIWILKDAMEMAKSADPKKVAAAMHAMDGTQSAGRYFPGGRLKFDANGRRIGAELVILQWQNGEPKPIYPPALATTQAAWPKR
jgi:branched-chain amino acid transport system substrate-binding protein